MATVFRTFSAGSRLSLQESYSRQMIYFLINSAFDLSLAGGGRDYESGKKVRRAIQKPGLGSRARG